MPHPVIYPGDFNVLLKKWEEQKAIDQNEGKRTFIADGQCARLPQELASVGHTSRWQPGDRVIDVARTLKPGTVIANFLFEYDKAWFPSSHFWHAALFVRGEGFSTTTGRPSKIWLFDQYNGEKKKTPSARWINCYTDEQVKRYGYSDSDNGSAFFVVVVR
jgi:hypothetical protein